MADFIIRNQRVLIGAYDMSGAINAVALDYGCDNVENTVLGDTTHSFAPGLKSAALAVSGWWDGQPIDEQLFAAMGAAKFPASALADPAEGSRAYFLEAVEAEYEGLSGAVGEMAAFSAAARSGDGAGLIAGTVIHNQTRTTSGNGTGFQLGAVGATQRVHGALHVLSAAGTTPSLTVVVQSDTSGFPSPTTQLSFAAKTAIGSEFLSAAGPITDDFWRANFTISGTSPSFLFALVLGIQ